MKCAVLADVFRRASCHKLAMSPGPHLPTRESFAERLRALRKARGFKTARSFAEALEIDQNTYTRYERGEVEPNVGLLDRIWNLLDLPNNHLIGLPLAKPIVKLQNSGGQGTLAGTVSQPARAPLSLSGQFAQGMAEPDDQSGYGLSQTSQPTAQRRRKSRRDALAWRLAQQLAQLGVGRLNSETPTPLVVMRETAAHYEALSNAPYEAITRFSQDHALQSLDEADKVAIVTQLVDFAGLVTQDALGH